MSVVKSPDGKFEASIRLLNIDGSIGVSQPYQVLVRSVATDSNSHEAVVSADKTDGLRIRWIDARQLEICYARARLYNFRNAYVSVNRDPPESLEVEVVLVKRQSLSECTPSTGAAA
jgi:hypothetical protein